MKPRVFFGETSPQTCVVLNDGTDWCFFCLFVCLFGFFFFFFFGYCLEYEIRPQTPFLGLFFR